MSCGHPVAPRRPDTVDAVPDIPAVVSRPGHVPAGRQRDEVAHVSALVVRARRVRRDGAADAGMTTAEYAVGTVAACGFGGILYKLLTSDSVVKMLKDILERALTIAF
jgi:uncharacterized protein DUF4244